MRKIVRDRIFKRDGAFCKTCGATEKLCIDHIMPLSKGGKHDEDNFQVLCGSCNSKKRDKIPFEKFIKVGWCDKSEDYFVLVDPILYHVNTCAEAIEIVNQILKDPVAYISTYPTASGNEKIIAHPDGRPDYQVV